VGVATSADPAANVIAGSTRSRFAATTARSDKRPKRSFGTPSLLALLLFGGCHSIEITGAPLFDALLSGAPLSEALVLGVFAGLVSIHWSSPVSPPNPSGTACGLAVMLAPMPSYARVDSLDEDRSDTEFRSDFALVLAARLDMTHCRYEGSVRRSWVLGVARDLLLLPGAEECVLPGRVCGASIAGCGLEAGVCGRLRFASQSCAVDVGKLLASMLKSMLDIISGIAIDSGNISTSDLDLCAGLVGPAATREVSSRI
jgi:hypothetical protein